MNMIRVTVLTLLVALCVPAAAFAQSDAPYAPKKIPLQDLIITDRFDTPPISFPWELISSTQVAERGRMDFEMVYNVDYDTVRERLREAYSDSEDFIELDPQALRFTEVTHLRLAGHELGDERGRITVGHPSMEPVFQATLTPDGPRTRITVVNMARSRQFSGFMPARVGYQPVGAQPIPFRWN